MRCCRPASRSRCPRGTPASSTPGPVSIVNAPGTVDAAYRGELAVTVINLDPREPVHLRRGDRIAQLVVQRVEHAVLHEVDVLPGSDRGEGGFGSSGR